MLFVVCTPYLVSRRSYLVLLRGFKTVVRGPSFSEASCEKLKSVFISRKSVSNKVLSVFIRVHLRFFIREASLVKREAE